MKAISLLRLYDKGLISHEQSGILENVQFDVLKDYVVEVFGEGSEILFGKLESGKTYFYLYVNEDDEPSSEFGDSEAMCVNDGYNWDIWLYEVEL